MKCEQVLHLDVTNVNTYQYVYAKQGDKNSRVLKVLLFNQGARVLPAVTDQITLRCIKPDQKSCIITGSVDDTGIISVELTDQCLAVPGSVRADITVQSGESVISSVTFFIQVSPMPLNANQALSTNEFLTLIKTLEAAKSATDSAMKAAQSANSASSAATEAAQSVRDDADAGKFNGAKGDKGDIGPTGPKGEQGPKGERGEKGDTGKDAVIDTTLTHAGEAADAKATGDAISAVKARQNILVGSDTGNPVAVDDAFAAPLCGLTVYGKSTQDGTPTPDAPVPIVSAGDGGSVAVTLSDGHGKTQTLTIPTPNGLPGIPVASGGNYTDPQGQQWVCDEVYFGKSAKVQRIGNGRVNTAEGEVNEQYRLALNNPGSAGKDGSFPCFLSITPYTSWTSCVSYSSIYLKNIAKFDGSFYTAEELKALAIDVDFVYQLATPIETPLTSAEIAAYKALTAYAPDTVVQASDGAGIKLDYQRDVNLVIKNLEGAIASMTTT